MPNSLCIVYAFSDFAMHMVMIDLQIMMTIFASFLFCFDTIF